MIIKLDASKPEMKNDEYFLAKILERHGYHIREISTSLSGDKLLEIYRWYRPKEEVEEEIAEDDFFKNY